MLLQALPGELGAAGIDPEEVRRACAALHGYFREVRAGARFTDGAFVTGLRVLLDNPEFLLFERHWVRRNKDLDRELHGVTKRCDPGLEFGLNVWNRNHFNPVRKAQWPWAETKDYADWVKPITYQHQAGGTYTKEMTQLHASLLRDLAPAEMTPLMYRIWGWTRPRGTISSVWGWLRPAMLAGSAGRRSRLWTASFRC